MKSSPTYNKLQHYLIEHACIWIFLTLICVNWRRTENKTDCHDITEILLKVALNTITLTPPPNPLIINLLQLSKSESELENDNLSKKIKIKVL